MRFLDVKSEDILFDNELQKGRHVLAGIYNLLKTGEYERFVFLPASTNSIEIRKFEQLIANKGGKILPYENDLAKLKADWLNNRGVFAPIEVSEEQEAERLKDMETRAKSRVHQLWKSVVEHEDGIELVHGTTKRFKNYMDAASYLEDYYNQFK